MHCVQIIQSDASSPASPHPDGHHPGREGCEPLLRAHAVKSRNIAKEMKETLVVVSHLVHQDQSFLFRGAPKTNFR